MSRKTFLIVCGGRERMEFKHIADPIKTIKHKRKLADDGTIIEGDFERK